MNQTEVDMQTTLEEVLVNAIQKTQGNIKKGVDFAIEQTPEIVQQALVWYATLSGLRMTLFVLCVAIIVWGNWMVVNKCKKNQDFNRGIEQGGFIIVIFVNFIFLLFSAFAFSLTWLKILIAPKLWLLEYAAGLTKGG